MKLFESAMYTLKRYADFSGRASREEFWWFLVFVIVANAIASLVGVLLGLSAVLPGAVAFLLLIPQIAVAVRRLHDIGKGGRELIVPGIMLLLVPAAFAFRGILPQIIALGFLCITLLAFGNLLTLFLEKGSSIPNRYGAAPTAFSYAR